MSSGLMSVTLCFHMEKKRKVHTDNTPN